MEALEELASRSPVEYFHVEEGTEELVLTTLWKRLLSAGLVDSQHESILLEQMFDVFDVSVLHGIQSLVVDVFQEVGCLVRACCLSSLTMIYFHADSNRGNFETLRGDDDGMPSSMDRTVLKLHKSLCLKLILLFYLLYKHYLISNQPYLQ